MTELDEFARWRQSMNGLLSEIESNLQQHTAARDPRNGQQHDPAGALALDPLASISAIFHCSNDDYEALRQEIQSAVQVAVRGLEQQIATATTALHDQIAERQALVDQRLGDRLHELAHGHRAAQVQAETDLRSELAALRRQLDLARVRSEDQTKTLAVQSGQCSEALALARRLEGRYDADQARQDDGREQQRQALQRLQKQVEDGTGKLDDVEERLQAMGRAKEGVDAGLGQLGKAVEQIGAEALLAEARAQRKFVEIGADLVEMHELVESQVQQTRSLLDTVQRSQQQLLDQCSNTSTQVADARVQIAVQTLTGNIERLNRDLQESRIQQDRVRGELGAEIRCLQETLTNKCEHRAVAHIANQVGELQKQLHEHQSRCDERHERHGEGHRDLSRQCADLKEHVESRADLLQSRADLRLDELDRKHAQSYQYVKADLEHQSEQIEAVKRSLMQWSDERSYNPIIESICVRTLERYEIDQRFRASIEDRIDDHRNRLQTDLNAKIREMQTDLQSYRHLADQQHGDLRSAFKQQCSRYDSDLEMIRMQAEIVSGNVRQCCETLQQNTIRTMTKLIEDQTRGVEERLGDDRERIEAACDDLRENIAKNAAMIMALGRNHLDEVDKRKELIKQIADMKSVLVEIRPELVGDGDGPVRRLRRLPPGQHDDDPALDRHVDRRTIAKQQQQQQQQQRIATDPAAVVPPPTTPSAAVRPQADRHTSSSSEDDERAVPALSDDDDDDRDQFSLIQEDEAEPDRCPVVLYDCPIISSCMTA